LYTAYIFFKKDNYRFRSATRLKLSKELKEKLLGSDREGLGIGLGLGIRIADLNQITNLKLSILAQAC